MPKKSICVLSLLGPALALWTGVRDESSWGNTLCWSVGLYFGMLVFFTAYNWFDEVLRPKVPAFGSPMQIAREKALKKEERTNLRLRREMGGMHITEPSSSNLRSNPEEGLDVRTIVDWVALAACAFTGLEIAVRHTIWRLSSDYSYEMDRQDPLLDVLANLFGKLLFWSIVFGSAGVLVYRSRSLQEFIWDVLPDEDREQWQEIDLLRRENRLLRAIRKAVND